MAIRQVSESYRALGRYAGECEAVAGDHDRAARVLGVLAARCRGVAAVFDAEPALHVHIEYLPYGRAVDLLLELVRQVLQRIGRVVRYERTGYEHPRQLNAVLWEEIEALTGRADALGALLVEHSPKLRLDTVAGSCALSRQLVDVDQLGEAADALDAATCRARRLPHPDPAVDVLADVATQLRDLAAALQAGAEQRPDFWRDYFDGLHRAAQAAWELERAAGPTASPRGRS